MIAFPIFDSSSTTGALLAGLTSANAGTCYYYREAAANETVISLGAGTVGTYGSGNFVALNGTNLPGIYQLSIPNAALAASANWVILNLKGATNAVPVVVMIQLTSLTDYPANVTAWNGSAVAAVSVSGIPKVDVWDYNGTAVATPATAGTPDVNVKNINNIGATSVATISATIGTTQPINFTGSGASALVKGDTIDWVSSAIAAPAASGLPDVNIKNVGNSTANTTAALLGVNIISSGNIDFTTLQKTSLNSATPVVTVGATGINNASFNNDVATTGNVLPTAVYNALNSGYTDSTSLTSGSVLDRVRVMSWILRNQMVITDTNGNCVLYKDDNVTSAANVASCLTDNSTYTTRLKLI
jgi:hypothetical protein